MKIGRCFLLLAALTLAVVSSARAEFPPKDLIVPSLVADTTAVTPGKPFTVGVRMKMKSGWHTYWQFPGDAGDPPKIDWQLPDGFKAGAIQWPMPKSEIDDPDLLSYIFPDEVLLMVEITPPAQLAGGEVDLHAKLRWLVCEKTCIPGKGEVDLKLPAGGEAAPANAELFAEWRARLPKTTGAPFQTSWDRSKADSFSLKLDGLKADQKVEFFPLPAGKVNPGHPTVSEPKADGSRTIAVPIPDGGAPNLPWQGVVAITNVNGAREGWVVSAAETKTAEQPSAAPTTVAETATAPVSTPSFGSFLGGGDSAPQTADQIALSLVSDTVEIGAGKPFTVGIKMAIKPSWYTYWRYPGDDGLTTTLKWTLPPGFTAGPASWPIPEAHTTMIGDEPHLGYIYKGEIVLPVQITPPAQLPEGKVKLHAALTWQVCSESNCVPGSGSADLELPVGTPAPANAEVFQQADAHLPGKNAPVQVTWDRTAADHFSLQISGATKDDTLEFFALPTGEAKPGHPKAEQTGPGAWTVTVPIAKGGAPNLPWEGVLVADKPDGSRIGWTISSTGAATSGETVAANQSNQASPPSSGGSSDGATSSTGDGGAPGFLWILFAAFLGGLILNVMPCVLPVIALKIFGFMKQAGDSPERIFRMGLAFVSGVFAFFLAMATAIIALKAAGSSFTWGYQFQNPFVLAGMICLVFVFGLNMLGVFELTLSSDTTSTLSKLSSKEGYGGAFLHGLFTTLLGTSCTAPFLGVSIGYATTQSAPAVILIFLVIAMGMSLPYLLLTARPKWMRFLPKPGAWMERAKQVMGFALLAVAAWLLGIFARYHPDSGAGLINYLLLLGLGCWIFGVMSRPAAGAATAIAIAIAGYFLLLNAPLREASQGGGKGDWLSDEVNASLKKGQPVFIDFTADWCINCKAYEHGVLDTEAVRDAMKNKNVLQLKADWTNGDPVITGWLKKFNRIGVPLYVLYRPGDKQPVVRDALTKQIVLDDLSRIKG